MATYKIVNGRFVRTDGQPNKSYSGLARSTPSGRRTVYSTVPDVEKIKAFENLKRKEALMYKTKTRERIDLFKKKRNEELTGQTQSRYKKYATIGRVTEKGSSKLTQSRKSSSLAGVEKEIVGYKQKANIDIIKKTQDEYSELNKKIDKINKEIQGYKPTKKVAHYVSSYVYKGKPISFASGQKFEKEYKEYKLALKDYEAEQSVPQQFLFPNSIVAPGYKVVKGKIVKQEEKKDSRYPGLYKLLGNNSKMVSVSDIEQGIDPRINRLQLDKDEIVIAPEFVTGKPEGVKLERLTSSSALQKGLVGTATQLFVEEQDIYKGQDRIDIQRLPFYVAGNVLEPATSLGQTVGQYVFDKGQVEYLSKSGESYYISSKKDIEKRVGDITQSFGESFSRDPLMLSAVSGVAGGIYTQATTKPIAFGSQLVGSMLLFEGAGRVISAGRNVFGRVTSIGKQYVPFEKLVAKEVMSGKKLFPEFRGTGKQLLKEYRTSSYSKALGGSRRVYSATDYLFAPGKRTLTIEAGRGLSKSADVPGLYTSLRGVSKYFLRMDKGLKTRYSLLPKLRQGSPKILSFVEKPAQIPAKHLTNISKAQNYFGKVGKEFVGGKGRLGTPYVSPAFEFGLKKEAEAVIQVASKFKRSGLKGVWQRLTGYSKYTTYKGKVIPIYEFENTFEIGKGIAKKFLSNQGYSSSMVGSSFGEGASKSIGSYAVSGLAGSYTFNKSSNKYNNYSNKSLSSFGESLVSVPSAVSVSKVSTPIKPSYPVPPEQNYVPLNYPSYLPSYVKGFPLPSYKPIESSSIILSNPPPTTPPTNIFLPRQESYKPKKQGTQLFMPYVRVKKNTRWVKASQKPLPYNMAFNQGLFVADNSTARTVKLEPRGRTKTKIMDAGFINDYKFRTRKTKSKIPGKEKIFVEKTRFAIDTIGEKKGLSAAKLLKSLRLF